MSTESFFENADPTELDLTQFRLDEHVHDIRELGGAYIPEALSDRQLSYLLSDLDLARFTEIDEVYETGVREKSSICKVPLPSENYPAIDWLGRQLASLAQHQSSELNTWVPNEATVMRYRGKDVGISPHRDMGYNYGLVAVYTLEGSATFSILRDESAIKKDRNTFGAIREFEAGPGSLIILRGDGFPGTNEPSALHSITAPLEGARTSVSYRMLSE